MKAFFVVVFYFSSLVYNIEFSKKKKKKKWRKSQMKQMTL